MSSVDEFSAAVGNAASTAESVIAAINAAKANGDELVGAIENAGAEGSAARARAIGARLESEAAAIALQLKDVLDEIREQAHGLREALTGALRGSGVHRPVSGAANLPPPRFDARRVHDSMPGFERRRGHQPRTHAVLHSGDGTRLEFTSGDDESTPRIREHMWQHTGPVRPPNGFWSESHAELKAAIAMSDKDIKRADLVINNPGGPCEGRLGCDGLLAKYLQPGSSLTVHWRNANGSMSSKTYTGTLR
jgi:hypothetical protein